MILDSFFVSLGFEVDTSKVAEFNAQAQALRETVLGIGKVAAGAAIGIGLLSIGVAESMAEIHDFAELNEISSRSLQAFGKVAVENDSSMEALKSSIQSVNKVIGEAALGVGRGAMTFEKFGFKAKDASGKTKNFDTMIGEIADKMKGLGRQEQIAMAEKLGIDPMLVKLLGQGSANLAKLREEAELYNPLTEAQYEMAEKVDKLYAKAKGSLGVFTKMIGAALLPLTKQVLETYLAWFKESRKATSGAVTSGIMILVGALGTLWDWTMRVVKATRSMYDWLAKIPGIGYVILGVLYAIAALKTYETFNKIVGAIKAMQIAFMALGSAISIPAILIGGLILALALLADDFVNFKEGNDSMIGSLSEKFPILLTIIDAISKGVSEFFVFWMGVWEQLETPLGDLAESLLSLAQVLITNLWPVVKMVLTGWVYILGAIAPLITAIIKLIAEDLAFAIQGWVMLLTGIVDIVTMVFGGVADIIGGTFTAIGNVIEAAMNGAKAAINFVMGLIDIVSGKISAFVDGVKNVAGVVSRFFGGSPKVVAAVAQAPAMEAAQAAQAGQAAPGGAITLPSFDAAPQPFASNGAPLGTPGAANVTTTTNSTSISGTQITIQSPDPTTAGESVRTELDRLNRQNIRNGQSQVAL